MKKTAIIEGNYRYELGREWNDKLPNIGFIMHNPSTANDEKDDPTIRRCMEFARLWGYGGILVYNLWNFIAPNLRELIIDWDQMRGDDQQAERIFGMVEYLPMIICAWGDVGEYRSKIRAGQVLNSLSSNRHKLYCLGVNKSGMPRHPLYVPGNYKPKLYTERP